MKQSLLLLLLLCIALPSQSQVRTIQSKQQLVQWVPAIPKPNGPVNLEISEITFSEVSGNNRIEAKEQFTITLTIKNLGPGTAYRVAPELQFGAADKYLTCKTPQPISILEPNNSQKFTIIGQSTASLPDGMLNINVSATEGNNFRPDSPQKINVQGYAFRPPKIIVKQHIFVSQNGGVPKPNSFITLKMIVKNDGESSAENVKVDFSLPQNAFNGDPALGLSRFVGEMLPKEEKLVEFPFFVNNQFNGSTVEINTQLTESYGRYAVNPAKMPAVDISKSVDKNSTTSIVANNENIVQTGNTLRLISDINENIPATNKVKPNIFALVIGNEGYMTNNGEIDVPYANSDASTFAEYLNKTFGIPQQNIILRKDATKATMETELERLCKLAKSYPDKENPAEIIVYYAGHGITDATSKESYLIPVDVSAKNMTSGIRTADIYDIIAKAEADKSTVFLDACFSGNSRAGSILEGRAMRVEPNKDMINGNMVVFAATSSNQIALAYDEQKHGMFTYFLLRKIQETQGQISYGDLAQYVTQQVNHTSLLVNKVEQTPDILHSPTVAEKWQQWTLTSSK